MRRLQILGGHLRIGRVSLAGHPYLARGCRPQRYQRTQRQLVQLLTLRQPMKAKQRATPHLSRVRFEQAISSRLRMVRPKKYGFLGAVRLVGKANTKKVVQLTGW